eukprot:9836540-Alexandrium_andersonii.AAC.1
MCIRDRYETSTLMKLRPEAPSWRSSAPAATSASSAWHREVTLSVRRPRYFVLACSQLSTGVLF